jgi:hypothetical protein
MRDGLIIFCLCAVAIIIGGWLFFYAPNSIAVFPHTSNLSVSYMPPADSSQAAAVEVPFSEIAAGMNAKVIEPKNYAVRAADALAQIWNSLGEPPPAPKVDFAKHDVIAVLAGQKPTGGYSVKVEKITDVGGKRIVSIVLTQPGAHCSTTESLTGPYELVAAPASALTPARVERVVVQDCQ